jgi:glutamate racemase
VSSAEETAKDVYGVLYRADLLRPDDARPPAQIFRATGPAELFARLSGRFLGPELAAAAEVAVGGAA